MQRTKRTKRTIGTAFEERSYVIEEARSDLAKGDLNPYFREVHAIANRDGKWQAAANPRSDGVVKYVHLEAGPSRN